MVKASGTHAAGTGRRSLGLAAGMGFALLAYQLACQASLNLDDYEIGAGGRAGTAGTGPVGGTGPGGTGGMGGTYAGGGGSYAGGAGTSSGGGGAGGCGEPPAKACPAQQVAVSGVVSVYDTQQPLASARVETNGESVSTDAQGDYSVQVPLDTQLSLTVEWPEGSGATVPAFRRTQLSFESGAQAARRLDIPAVSHDWLEAVAKDCGALAEDAPAEDVQRYFNQRSTLVVDVVGDGVDGIIQDQINVDVALDGASYPNFGNQDPDAMWPTRICFLDGPDAGGELRGGTVNQTTGLGRFVIFRVRNEEGRGNGTATVSIVNFDSSHPIEFVGSGSTAVVRVGGAW
jgi:hypothetical protein